MSRVQRMDSRPTDLGSVEKAGVRERSQIQHTRNPNKNWPFLFSYKEEGLFINAVKQKSEYQTAQEVGDALL